MAKVRGPFDPEPTPIRSWLVPVASILAGSMVTLIPVVAPFPLLPPFGLLMLIGWRLGRPDVLPVWSTLLFAAFDDLLSGQPLGSAILLWGGTMLALDLVDQRVVARDFWQDWLLASAAIGACLLFGRLIASPLRAHVDTLLLLQILLSVMVYPIVTHLCALLDRKRTLA